MKRRMLCVVFVAAFIGSAFSVPQPVGAQYGGDLGFCQVVSETPKPQETGIACVFIPVTPFAWAVCSSGPVRTNCNITISGEAHPNGVACKGNGPKPTIVGPCVVVPFAKYFCLATWGEKPPMFPKTLTCTS